MTRLRVGLIAILAILGLAMLFTTVASAQEVAGLNGTVTDTSGAVVPGVSITLVSTRTNTTYQATTNELGLYSISKLLPGPGYKLTLKRDGFETAVINDLYLTVGTTRTENVQLKVGHTNETVEVSAASEGVALNTTDATVGSNFNMNAVAQLPVQIRDSPAALLTLQPGVVSATSGSDQLSSRAGAVTGARGDQNNVTLDGLDVNDFATGQAFSTVANAPVDSIQEFRGETAGALAASGRGSGAQVNMVTMSGTNAFHGGAWDYHRNTIFAANSWFNKNRAVPIKRPALIRNQFGAKLGGPVVKDKLFFFFNYNGRREAQSANVLTIVPLDSFRNGTINYIKQTDGSGNVCSTGSKVTTAPQCVGTLSAAQVAALDPQGIGGNSALLQYIAGRYPHANDLSAGDGLNTGGFRFSSPVRRTGNDYVTKIDYNINSSMRLAGRFSILRDQYGDSVNYDAPVMFPGDPLTKSIANKSYAYVLSHTWTINPNTVNQFTYGKTVSKLAFPTGFNPAGTTVWTFATLDGPYYDQSSQARVNPVPVFRDDLTWQKGSHQFQFGGTFKPIKTNSRLVGDTNGVSVGLGGNTDSLNDLLRPADILTTTSTGSSTTVATTAYDTYYAFLLGRIGSVASDWNYDNSQKVLPQGSGATRQYRYYEFEGYVQDTWKATQALTFTYGLRYQYYSVPYEANGLQAVQNLSFDQLINARVAAGAAGIAGDDAIPITTYDLGGKANGGKGLYKPSYYNFAPRFSFAYSPSVGFLNRLFGDRKSVIRGGTGIVYDHPVVNALNFIQDQNSYMFQASSSRIFGDQNANLALMTDPRFTGINTIPAPTPAPTIDRPYSPYVDSGYVLGNANNEFNYAIDPFLKTPYSIVFNLGLQRELPGHFVVEATYVGRLGRRLIAQADAAQLIDFKDPQSGQLMSQAFAALSQQLRDGTAFDANHVWIGTPQPFFENQILNYSGYTRGTRLVARNIGDLVQIGDFADTMQWLNAVGVIAPNVGLAGQFAGNTYITNKANSNYHGLLMSLHRNFANGLQFDVNYTYSHSIDNASGIANSISSNTGLGFVCDAMNLRTCRGNSDFDVKHIVTGNFIYELPFGKNKSFGRDVPGWANQIIGGWSLSGIPVWRSGIAFSNITGAYLMGYANNSPGIFNGDRKAVAVDVHKVDSDGTLNLFADPQAAIDAFDYPLGFQIGSRNNLRGPRYFNLDLGVAKKFPVTEQFNVQFRADAFNALNHASFGLPGGGGNGAGANISSGVNQFGKITSTSSTARVVQFSLRVEF